MSAAPGRPKQARAAARSAEALVPAHGQSTARLAGHAGYAGTAARRCICEVPAAPEALIPQREALKVFQ